MASGVPDVLRATEELRGAISGLAQLDASDPEARAYLVLALSQIGRRLEAIELELVRRADP